MSDPSRERALRALRKTQDEFQEEFRRGPELYSVLFAASSPDHPKAQEPPPVPAQAGRPLIRRFWYKPGPYPFLTAYYYGDEARLDRFGQMARHAALAWVGHSTHVEKHEHLDAGAEANLDWNYGDLIPRFDELRNRLDVPLWLLVAHSLARQRLHASPLQASRKVWDEGWPVVGHFTLPFDKDDHRRELGRLPSELRKHVGAGPPPDYFFSELRDDLFGSSVQAIDLVPELSSVVARSPGDRSPWVR